MGHGAGDRVIHHVQTGIAVHDHMLRRDPHDVRHHMLGLGKAVQHAVIADVDSLRAVHMALGIQHVENVHPHVQLGHRRLPSGHVQLQALGLLLSIAL